MLRACREESRCRTTYDGEEVQNDSPSLTPYPMTCQAAPAPLLRREYAVDELSCAACESSVRSALSGLPAVTSVSTSLQLGTVVVEGEAREEAIVDALARGGFSARLIGSGDFTAVPPHVGPPHENTACVAEFKGAAYGTGSLCGVLRVAQLSGMRPDMVAHSQHITPTSASHAPKQLTPPAWRCR